MKSIPTGDVPRKNGTNMMMRNLVIAAGGLLLAVSLVGEAAAQDSELLAKGKLIFEETAGGVGCQLCHGMDGKSGEIGPPNAGASESMIRNALKGVPDMIELIKLKNSEIKAVAAYVKWLGEQP